MPRILLSIFRKEFIHIGRDPQTLVIMFLMPVMMLFLFGYAIDMEMKEIPTAVIDYSQSAESRMFTEQLASNGFYKIYDDPDLETDPDLVFRKRTVRCIVLIPENYSTELARTGQGKIQLLVDASDPNAANFINNYISRVAMSQNMRLNQDLIQVFTLEPRLLYNPDMKSAYFFVPGLIAVILLLISALLTSITIVREKERGSMEQILVSPVRPVHILVGKVLPYSIIGYLAGLMILLIGMFWFDVPVRGSFTAINLMMVIYILTGLSFGLLVSTVARTQQVAMMAALIITILPTVMLSGFMFPIRSMPEILQYVTKIIPATYFLEILRKEIRENTKKKDDSRNTLYGHFGEPVTKNPDLSNYRKIRFPGHWPGKCHAVPPGGTSSKFQTYQCCSVQSVASVFKSG